MHVGGHNHGALTAFDAGDRRGRSGTWDGDGPGYGSPVAVDVDGTRQVVVLTQENVVGVVGGRPARCCGSGRSARRHTQNAITPILYQPDGDRLGLDRASPPFRIVKKNGGWDTETVWENSDVAMAMSNGVIVHDTLVSLSHKNSGQFFRLDARTGKALWTSAPRQATNAAISRAGDLPFVLKGRWRASS